MAVSITYHMYLYTYIYIWYMKPQSVYSAQPESVVALSTYWIIHFHQMFNREQWYVFIGNLWVNRDLLKVVYIQWSVYVCMFTRHAKLPDTAVKRRTGNYTSYTHLQPKVSRPAENTFILHLFWLFKPKDSLSFLNMWILRHELKTFCFLSNKTSILKMSSGALEICVEGSSHFCDNI